MYQVYGFPKSRSGRVLWMLEEIEAPYRYIPVNLGAGEGQSPEYLRLNPGGKVPTLVADEIAIFESGAILAWLGDRHPDSCLVPPAGSPERARYDQWSYFVLTELEQPLWTIAKHKFVLPRELRVPQIAETCLWEFARACRVLETGLGSGPHLVGRAFTAADLLAAHTIAWAQAFKVPIESKTLTDYGTLHNGRPARRRAIEAEQQA